MGLGSWGVFISADVPELPPSRPVPYSHLRRPEHATLHAPP